MGYIRSYVPIIEELGHTVKIESVTRRLYPELRGSLLKRRKVGSLALLLTILGSVLFSVGNPSSASTAHANTLTPITVAGAGTPNGVDGALAYCAYSGVCAKHGILLQIVYPPSGGTTSDAAQIANNTYQMAGISGPSLFQLYEDGVKLVAVGNSYSDDLSGLSVRAVGADRAITKPQDLRGKIIGVSAGSTSAETLKIYLQHFGLAPGSYNTETMNLGALITAFTAGKVDAAVVYPMDTSPQFNHSGVGTRNFYFSKVKALNYLFTAWVMSPTWVAAHKHVTAELVAALEESTAKAVAHPAVAGADVVKSDPRAAPTLTVTVKQWTGNRPFLQSPNDTGHPYMYMAKKDWAAALTFAETYFGVKPMNPGLVFTNSYVPKS